MVGGALFPLLVIVITGLLGDNAGAAVASTASTLAIVSVALLLPGAIGLGFAHRTAFGRVSTAAVGALVAGFLVLILLSVASLVLDTVRFTDPASVLSLLLIVVGSVSTGAAIAYHRVLQHGLVGASSSRSRWSCSPD
jgi:Mg2+/Co2+ transporter CorB